MEPSSSNDRYAKAMRMFEEVYVMIDSLGTRIDKLAAEVNDVRRIADEALRRS